ncbi:GIY-YIG nuclease family protein [Pseudomonas mendocina]|uniref:GIY-YIG nuclease family protein n=1 Tax=Ectopseudomonas mendocina TaxID=300 RepID=UPI0023DCE6CA|nr:GIY-YIG nuclease family protein [Pseudomonas mendocina]MDF2077101.1 GIY-YIG nuclease family protein [Pseudomonas mendocina]
MIITTLFDAVKNALSKSESSLTPQEIRERIKLEHPQFYNTESHQRNVTKGHYKNTDHALLAQIYGLVRTKDEFFCDTSFKPMKISISRAELVEDLPEIEDFENTAGKVYILKTGTHTKDGKEIIKIGHTTQEVTQRISQLYTTGVPFEFKIHAVYQVQNHIELEQALHKLLFKFRLNKSREFFTEEALEFIDQIVSIHRAIQNSPEKPN